MSLKKTERSEHPPKSMLSEESQRLLEEIFDFFENREKAKKDPDLCLEAMLTEICEDLRDHPITSTLQITLDNGCRPNAAERIREEKKRGEHGRLRKGRGQPAKAHIGCIFPF